MSRASLALNPCAYGLNYHDPSVAIYVDGNLVVALEETKCIAEKKHGVFPENALREALNYAGLSYNDLTDVFIPFDPELTRSRGKFIPRAEQNINADSATRSVRKALLNSPAKIEYLEHHYCHAIGAFCCSGFEDAIIIITDGVGELCSQSVWYGKNNSISKLDEFGVLSSLGYFYAAITSTLGFSPWDQEGKTMALASYGKINSDLERKFKTFFSDKGSFSITRFNLCFENGYGFNYHLAAELLKSHLGIHAVKEEYPACQDFCDLALLAQKTIQTCIEDLYIKYSLKLGCTNLCVSGGVHNNCKLNGYLRESESVSSFYCFPVPGDAGLVLSVMPEIQDKEIYSLDTLYLGIPPSNHLEVEKYISNQPFTVRLYDERFIVDLLVEGKIVFYVDGRSEFGQRALGARSILARPDSPDISKLINKLIKNRDAWRPFAPVVLGEYFHQIVDSNVSGEGNMFMIETHYIKEKWREALSGTCDHNDHSSRIQCVYSSSNARLYSLISSFKENTGIPALLNTSLNPKGKPILNSMEEIFGFFEKSGADALIFEDHIITRSISNA